MLSTIVKEHQGKQAIRKERQGVCLMCVYISVRFAINIIMKIKIINLFTLEQKRKEAVQAANNLTQALVDHLNVG